MNEKLKKLLSNLILMIDDDVVNFESYNIDYTEVQDLLDNIEKQT